MDVEDPYEDLFHPEIRLDTVVYSPEEKVCMILEYLREKSCVRREDQAFDEGI